MGRLFRRIRVVVWLEGVSEDVEGVFLARALASQ